MDKTNVPIINLKQGYLEHRDEIDAAVRRVLESGWYILGSELSAFESAFAKWCETSFCVGVGNGTDAIVVALRALGVGPGDAVFTVSHTAVATVAAIHLVGAEPVLVDIEPDSFTIDPAKLEEAITHHRKTGRSKPKAVIGVHLYGNMFDVPAVKKICEREGLLLIEDCAQAHGARMNGEKAGTFADIATFSFYPTKNLGAFGDAGAVTTNDEQRAKAADAIRQYGWKERYLSDIRGLNSRLDELHAAILQVRLKYLDQEIAARRRIAALYDAGLQNLVVTPSARNGVDHAYHLYVIRSKNRDRLAANLKERGIGTGVHYPVPVHLQRAYSDQIAIAPSGMAETERASREVLSLPMHAFLTDNDAQAVIEAVRESV